MAQPAHTQSVADMTHQAVGLLTTGVEAAGKTAEVAMTSTRVEGAYDGLVLRGFAADGAARGWVRFPESGDANAWHELYVVFSATGGTFLAGYPGEVVRTNEPFELRFEVTAGAAFRVDEAGVFDRRRDAESTLLDDTGDDATGKATTADLIIPPVVIRRSTWGAQPFRGDPSPLAPRRSDYRHITFHHAAGFGAATKEEGMEQVRRIQDFHQNGRGWSDIGYHFVMDERGNMYQGRPFWNENQAFADAPDLVLGAHAGGANTGNIGVCVLGCYHPPEGGYCQDVLGEAALDSLSTMFGFLSEQYDVPPREIKGHRDFGTTACPGDNNYARLPEIRDRVGTLLVTGNRPVGAASIAAETDDDGVVRLSWSFLEDHGIARYRVERAYLNTSTVIFRGEGAVPETFVDRDVATPGTVVYRLYATNEAGREQLLAVAEVQVTTPGEDVLASAFPNPFAHTTTIRYFLDQEGFVRLRVYDVTGREVAALVDTHQEAGRWYTAAFDGRSLPGGTYFYRLEVEGFSGVVYDETRALVLVR